MPDGPPDALPRPALDASTLQALQRVTDAALAYLPEEALLAELLARVAEIMAVDTVAILMLQGDELHARAAKGIEEEVEQGVRIPLGKGFAGRIAADRRAVYVPDVDHADILNPILREKGIRSLLGVPLLHEGDVIGVLHVGSLVPRTFGADDSALLQLAADRAALAIQHGRVFEREREARAAAEAATAHLQAVQRVTDATLAYLPEEELLTELLTRVADIMRVDTVAILLREGDHLHARAAKGIEEEVEQGVRIPVGRGFAGRIAAERRPVFVPDVSRADIYNPILREKGIQSLLGVPLLVEGAVIGVLHVGSLVPRTFDDDDRTLLQLAADRAALAIEQARLYEQRRVAEVLQRRLLPGEHERRPGLEVAGRYLPAAGMSLGGDWYDAFELPDGRLALVVGDVVGHGMEAAAVMGQLRASVRAYAVAGYPATEVVERLNTLMLTLGPTAMTTMALLVLDGAEETVELVNAGHLPPIAIAPDGAATLLRAAPAVPLGVVAGTAFRSTVVPFPTGSVAVLYTDGLVERRDEPVDAGIERLRLAIEGVTDVEDVRTTVIERVVPVDPADDVAFIAARIPPLPEALDTSWPARADSLAPARRLLRRWLRARGAAEAEAFDVVVAAGEACANAIEHATGPGRGTFTLRATCQDGTVEVVVADHGAWRPPRESGRGRGLGLMAALVDSRDVRRSDAGTTVVLRKALGGAA